MIDNIIKMFTLSFSSVASWFGSLVTATGADSLILPAIFLIFLVRYLIGPIVGGASDKVKKTFKRSKNSSDQEE